MSQARLVGERHVVERAARALGYATTPSIEGLGGLFGIGAPSDFVAISPSGVPVNSSDVPTFGGGAFVAPPHAPPVNVDSPPPRTFGATPSTPAKDCTCEKMPWWAWLGAGLATGATAYGVAGYLLRK